MNHEIIYDHGIMERDGWQWALLQGVSIIHDRHSKGQNLLALDAEDSYVLARVSMTWKEYFTLSDPELTEVFKRLVADAKAVQRQRVNDVDLFD